MNLLLGGALGGGLGGGFDKITGGGEAEGGESKNPEEDPEVIQARIEAEERRQEKHRKKEQERENMRQGIRDKYNIQKKDDPFMMVDPDCEGRIGGGKRKTPEELAKEMEDDDSFLGQLGLNQHVNTAKEKLSGLTETVKGFLPFGKWTERRKSSFIWNLNLSYLRL